MTAWALDSLLLLGAAVTATQVMLQWRRGGGQQRKSWSERRNAAFKLNTASSLH